MYGRKCMSKIQFQSSERINVVYLYYYEGYKLKGDTLCVKYIFYTRLLESLFLSSFCILLKFSTKKT